MNIWTMQSFNSKLVRLKGGADTLCRQWAKEFNSKLVRLKVVFTRKDGTERDDAFQFQTGSIKREAKLSELQAQLEFQFQTGSIKRLYENRNYITQ